MKPAQDTCIVIPMKHPTQSKMRLAQTLDNEQRTALALQLFENTLLFFRRHFPQLTVLVVTPSAWIAAITQQAGCEVLLEASPAGLNQALQRASAWTLRHRFKRQLIIPADIQQLNKTEISRILADKQHAVIIAAAKDGGTNALLCSPAEPVRFHYGHDSARLHASAARQQNLNCLTLQLPLLSADIDTPDDLASSTLSPLLTHKAAPYA